MGEGEGEGGVCGDEGLEGGLEGGGREGVVVGEREEAGVRAVGFEMGDVSWLG